MTQRLFPTAAVVAALVIVLGVLINAPAAGAQATPGLQDPEAEPEVRGAHPTHIHAGTCEDVGDLLFPLDDINPVGAQVATPASPMSELDATPIAVDALGGTPVVVNATVGAAAPLEDILAVPTVIDIHVSEDNEERIACGEITGSPADGVVTVQIRELNESGYHGDAVLQDSDAGTTTVTITLVREGDGTTGTPMASPPA